MRRFKSADSVAHGKVTTESAGRIGECVHCRDSQERWRPTAFCPSRALRETSWDNTGPLRSERLRCLLLVIT